MKKPPSLYLQGDNYHLIKQLPDESAGMLFKALYEYNHNDTICDLPDVNGIKGIFDLMREQIDRNKEHYADVTRKRSAAGKKGGAPKGNLNAKKSSIYSADSASFDIKEAESKSMFDD